MTTRFLFPIFYPSTAFTLLGYERGLHSVKHGGKAASICEEWYSSFIDSSLPKYLWRMVFALFVALFHAAASPSASTPGSEIEVLCSKGLIFWVGLALYMV